MAGLLGKIVETEPDDRVGHDFVLGKRLRALRELSGLSAGEVSAKLGISQDALTALEERADIQVSTLHHYIEALGATLRINASFSMNSPIAFRIADAFEVDIFDENQFVLPIFGDEDFRHQRDVVLSIKPHYSSQILDGKKTVELRRRFPVNVPSGTIAYIYSTTPDKALLGFAEIESVVKKDVSAIWKQYKNQACIAKGDFDSYFSGQEHGFALRFSRAKRFSEAINLVELRERFGFEPPQSFLYAKPLLREALRYEFAELPH